LLEFSAWLGNEIFWNFCDGGLVLILLELKMTCFTCYRCLLLDISWFLYRVSLYIWPFHKLYLSSRTIIIVPS